MAKKKTSKQAPPPADDRDNQNIISFRCGDDVAARIDAHANRLGSAGVTIPRSNAVLNIILYGLDRLEAEAERRRV